MFTFVDWFILAAAIYWAVYVVFFMLPEIIQDTKRR